MGDVRIAVEALRDNGRQDALDWDLIWREDCSSAEAAAAAYNGYRAGGGREVVKMAVVERAGGDGEWLPEDIAAACLMTPRKKTRWALARAALADGPLSRRDLASISVAAGARDSSAYRMVCDWHLAGRIVNIGRGVYGLPEGADPWWYGLRDESIGADLLREYLEGARSRSE